MPPAALSRMWSYMPAYVVWNFHYCSKMKAGYALSKTVRHQQSFPTIYISYTNWPRRVSIHMASEYSRGEIAFGWVKCTIFVSASVIMSSVSKVSKRQFMIGTVDMSISSLTIVGNDLGFEDRNAVRAAIAVSSQRSGPLPRWLVSELHYYHRNP